MQKKWQLEYREIVVRSMHNKRLQHCIKENYKKWEEHEDFKENFLSAFNYLKADMAERHTSYTIHIRLVRAGKPTNERLRVAQIKWGFNNLPFVRIDYDTLGLVKEEAV